MGAIGFSISGAGTGFGRALSRGAEISAEELEKVLPLLVEREKVSSMEKSRFSISIRWAERSIVPRTKPFRRRRRPSGMGLWRGGWVVSQVKTPEARSLLGVK